jgi:hypothetical protein
VRLVYGRRRLDGEGGQAQPEVLMVDASRPHRRVDEFKYLLNERFGLDSRRYEVSSEYELYLRIADPGYEGVRALLGSSDDTCWLIAHEFMGVCTVLRSILGGDPRFRTAFYAHEVATARMLVEDAPGHDLGFYGVLRLARQQGGYLSDYFGSQDWYHKHALICQAWRCDAVLAVGDRVVDELRFLGPQFAGRQIDLVYNGIPAKQIEPAGREQARARLWRYTAALLGAPPDWLFTHVTRLVRSKALWRDLLVMRSLDVQLAQRGERAVLLVLASETGPRSPAEVRRMAAEYEWPLAHREGPPDLTPGELAFDLQVRRYNARARASQVVFVNQFGFSRDSCGPSMSAEVSFADLRCGTDAEFGQSMYEPFGIAMLEPVGAGAVCVVSDVCGCLGFARRVLAGRAHGSLVEGEYTALAPQTDIWQARSLGPEDCARVEVAEAPRVAGRLLAQLPREPGQRERLLRDGRALAGLMSWERVVQEMLLPALKVS